MEFQFGQKLDEFDFQILGVKKYWNIRETAFMLSSFEMELHGYFNRPDSQIVHSKVYKKYEHVVTNILLHNDIDIDTPPDSEKDQYFQPGTIIIDSFTTTFPQDDILKYIGLDRKLQVDVIKLKSLLYGAKSQVEEAQIERKKLDLRTNAKKGRQSQAANERWQLNQQLKERSKDYAISAISNGCICNHGQLGKFIYQNGLDDDGNYLLEGAYEAQLSERGVVEAIKELFHAEGISRIKGEPGVKDAKDCPVHPQKKVESV